MPRQIHCQKLNKKAPGLTEQPYPGKLGEKVFANISEEAWILWMSHQTMLINEYRLNLMDANSRAFIEKEMEKFLFTDNAEKPAGFTPPE